MACCYYIRSWFQGKVLAASRPCSVNQVTLYIVTNPVVNKQTKHIKVDYLYIRDKLKVREIKRAHIYTKEQMIDVFTKAVVVDQFRNI